MNKKSHTQTPCRTSCTIPHEVLEECLAKIKHKNIDSSVQVIFKLIVSTFKLVQTFELFQSLIYISIYIYIFFFFSGKKLTLALTFLFYHKSYTRKLSADLHQKGS